MSGINSQSNINHGQSFFDWIFCSNLDINCLRGDEEDSKEFQNNKQRNFEAAKLYIVSLEAFLDRCHYFAQLQNYERGPYVGLIRYSHEQLLEIKYVFDCALYLYPLDYQFMICIYIAKIYCYSHVNHKALVWLDKAEDVQQRLNDDQKIQGFILRLLHMKEDVLCRTGDSPKSYIYSLKSTKFWEKHHKGEEESESWSYINLGNIFLSERSFRNALICYKRALEIRKNMQVVRVHLLALTYAHLANCYVKWEKKNPTKLKKRLELATEAAKEAINCSKKTSEHFYVEDLAQWYLAEVDQIRGKVRTAIKQKQKALVALQQKLPCENCLTPKLQSKLEKLEKANNL